MQELRLDFSDKKRDTGTVEIFRLYSLLCFMWGSCMMFVTGSDVTIVDDEMTVRIDRLEPVVSTLNNRIMFKWYPNDSKIPVYDEIDLIKFNGKFTLVFRVG